MVGTPTSSPEVAIGITELHEPPNNPEPAEQVTQNMENGAPIHEPPNNPEPVEQVTQNMENGAPATAEKGNEEHAKRLTTYAKTAILITFSLIVLFYTTKLNKQDDNLFILAPFGSLLLALACALVLTVLICSVKSHDRNRFLCRHEEKMYLFIYGSNFVLMLTAYFFLLLCTFEYAYLAVFLVPALLIIVTLYLQGSRRNHTKSIQMYGDHDSELNRFSELSAAVVLMLFTGLSTTIFSSPTLSRQNHIKGTECFLFVVIVMSLVIMLLTSVPPAVTAKNMIARMVGAVKFLSYAVVSLLIMVGLMAVSEILQGIVVFSMFAHIIGATYWLVSEVSYDHADQDCRSTGAQPEPKKELDSLSMVFATSAFSVLMSVYAQNVDNVEPYSWWNKFLMALCMISLCSAFISCLTKMVVFNYALETPAWAKGKRVLSIITYISMFVALISTFMLAVYIKLILKLNV